LSFIKRHKKRILFMGVYATALWLMGRHAALPEVAAPAKDLNALEQDIEAVRQRARRMSRKSVSAQ
jgi:hypothetical protein